MRSPLTALTVFALLLLLCGTGGEARAAAESIPPLPAMEDDELANEDGIPPLPETGDAEPSAEPALPPMPETEDAPPPLPPTQDEEPTAVDAPDSFSQMLDRQLGRLPVPLHGFWSVRAGPRYVDTDHHGDDFTLAESRLQLKSNPYWNELQFRFKADFVHDAVTRDLLLEVREANVAFTPVSFLDVRLGRQVLTWGTGDLLFLNDLFPKDFVSFFIGRDVEYLKKPSDAVRMSFFAKVVNIDLVYTPHFDPDQFISGKRLTYFNPLTLSRQGEDVRIRNDEPESWFEDDEIALRLYRSVGSYELALYGYEGFWKAPMGVDPAAGLFTHPPLRAYGASVRGPLAKGIGNVEFSYYDSRDDRGGDNPFVPNSQLRFLAGYSQDLPRVAQNLTVGVQYYLEHMLDHDDYRDTLPAGFPEADQNRHLLTLRLTKLLMNQDMTLSLFTFWSPSDQDAHLRPYVAYDITDRWRVDGGANVFLGEAAHTQFGQLDQNSNVYVGLRYSF